MGTLKGQGGMREVWMYHRSLRGAWRHDEIRK